MAIAAVTNKIYGIDPLPGLQVAFLEIMALIEIEKLNEMQKQTAIVAGIAQNLREIVFVAMQKKEEKK